MGSEMCIRDSPCVLHGPVLVLGQLIWLYTATAWSDWALPEILSFPTFKEALVSPKMMEIPSQNTGRASGAFMEATEDTEGIMVNTGNGSTKVVHFEPRFEGEEVVLAPFV